jgi:hypothetical protein
MDHSPFLLHSDAGADLPAAELGGGYAVHGGTARQMSGSTYYRYANGVMRSGMLVCAFQLEDMPAGDGGFGVVAGSHKANYPVPPELSRAPKLGAGCRGARDANALHPALTNPSAPAGSISRGR